MACIASVLLSSSLKMGVLDPRMILLSLRNRDLATKHLYFIKLNTQHIGFRKWQREMLKIGLCCRDSIPFDVREWAEIEQSSSSSKTKNKRRVCGFFMIPLLFPWCPLDVTGSNPGKLSILLSSDCPDAMELGELKACVHADSVAQLIAQDALLAVVGQLEQVEACWWSGKPPTRLLLADSEKAPKNTAKGVSSVLIIWNFHTTDGERWFEVGKT